MTQISRFWDGTTTGDAGAYSDAQFAKVIESLTYNHKQSNSLAIGGIIGTASSGSYPLKVYENSPTGMSVKVDKGSYWFLGRLYLSDSIETITIDSNSSGNPRIDSIILSCNYTGQTIRLGIVKGTPSGSPVAPTLTQTIGSLYQYKLADIAVANGATTIVNANITNTGSTNYYGGNTYYTSSNAWTANTNTNVTLANNTADQLVGLSITFTPSGSKVFFAYSYSSQYGFATGGFHAQTGYKVNSGAITYIDEDAATSKDATNHMTTLYVLGVTVTPNVPNTITMYAKTGNSGISTSYYWGRILVMEQAN